MRLRVLHHPPIVSRQRTKLHFRFDVLTLRLADDLRRRQRALGDDVESREFRPLRFLFSSLRRAESFRSITTNRIAPRSSVTDASSRLLARVERTMPLAPLSPPRPDSRLSSRPRRRPPPRLARRRPRASLKNSPRASTSREDVDFSVPSVAPPRFREPPPRALGDVDRETRAREQTKTRTPSSCRPSCPWTFAYSYRPP